jgi:two-component system, LuxR family, response regulator FixJ
MKIAVVDDDKNDLSLIDRTLLSAGFQTLVFPLGSPLVQALSSTDLHAAVIDVVLPDMSGLDIIAEISRRKLLVPCVVASGQSDIAIAVKAMKLGAVDFIEKPVEPELLLDAVKDAVTNRTRRMSANCKSPREAQALMGQLTPRERQVLQLLLQGFQNKMIAYEIGISQRTVEVHRARLMKRLNVNNFAELVRTAVQGGFGNASDFQHSHPN